MLDFVDALSLICSVGGFLVSFSERVEAEDFSRNFWEAKLSQLKSRPPIASHESVDPAISTRTWHKPSSLPNFFSVWFLFLIIAQEIQTISGQLPQFLGG